RSEAAPGALRCRVVERPPAHCESSSAPNPGTRPLTVTSEAAGPRHAGASRPSRSEKPSLPIHVGGRPGISNITAVPAFLHRHARPLPASTGAPTCLGCAANPIVNADPGNVHHADRPATDGSDGG